MKKNKKSKNNKVIFVIIMICIVILSIFLIKSGYKILKVGNNKISNTTEGISEYILNMSSYEANTEVTIKSNKNTNKYILNQEYVEPNIAKQIVVEPSNIQGLTIINDGEKVTIQDTKLNLTNIYENYNYIAENHLFLNTFIKNYKESEESTIEEKDNIVIMKTNIKNNNKYLVNKKLYIDKNTTKPIKMEIHDINQNIVVYILYNEIKINSTNKNEILAVKLNNN